MNIVVITTIINPERALALSKQYLEDNSVDKLFIYDNGHEESGVEILMSINDFDERAEYVNTYGLSLHQQWNKAFQYAIDNHPSNIVISNDDMTICNNLVKLLSNAIELKEEYWISYPSLIQTNSNSIDITRGTYADGGMNGCCFMVSTRAFISGVPLIDENFIHWCGDDDLANNVSRYQGTQIRVNEAWINHEVSSTSSSPGFEWVHEAVKKDVQYLRTKWGVTRTI